MAVRVEYVTTSDGVRIAYATRGRGPAIVSMPPIPCRHVELPPRARMLAAIDAAGPRSRERFPLEPPHSIRSDPHAYLRLLAGDRRRARLRGGTVPARRTVEAADRLPAT